MKILIEGSPMFGTRTGVGNYTSRLLEALFKRQNDNQYTIFGFLFYGNKLRTQSLPEGKNVRYRFIRFLPGRLFNRLRKHVFAPPVDLLLGSSYDLALFTNFIRLPLSMTRRSATIIYDLSFIHVAEFSQSHNRKTLTKSLNNTLKKSSHIITISESAKKEIIEYGGLKPESVSVVEPAVDHEQFFRREQTEISTVQTKYGISTHYILYTGTIEPRKNIVGLVDAYAALPHELRARYQLVLAGGKGWNDQDIYRRIDSATRKEGLNILLPGYIDDTDLPALYSGAKVFVFPSFYEGFGMPPLESMACGTPVVTSNNTSLPEVVGDAGIMVDAQDTAGLAGAIAQVLQTPELARKLARDGIARSKRFSWENSAQKLESIIAAVGKR